jgi:hypothetical protein
MQLLHLPESFGGNLFAFHLIHDLALVSKITSLIKIHKQI